MPRHLEIELDRLKEKLLKLSEDVQTLVSQAVLSVGNPEQADAQMVIDQDFEIDEKEVEVEEDCLKILALHQPVAIDLRFVIAVLKINNDLERVGDLAVNIAERSIFLSKNPPVPFPFDFQEMSKKAEAMLKKSMKSMIEMNSSLAHQVCKEDDEVDAINRQMYTDVFDGIRKEPKHFESLIQYLLISRHLERIADYATNIAEDVIYMVDGTIVRHNPEEYEPILG